MKNKEHQLLRTTSLGLLLITALLAAASFSVLYRGVTVTAFSVAGIHVEQLSLRWQRKLVLDIERIIVPATGVAPSAPAAEPAVMEPKAVRQLLDAIKLVERLFKRIEIRDIQVADVQAQFSYQEAGKGQLLATGPQVDIALEINIADDTLAVDIQRLLLPQAGVSAVGWATVDTDESQLRADLSVVLADMLPVNVELNADRRQLSFRGRGEASISDVAPVVDLFGLKPVISRWISDYLEAGEVTLQSISGTVPYHQPAQILQTLRAELLVKDVEYTFAQGLQPARAPQVRVVFDGGVLGIYPDDATFYGQRGGDTYVDIDFNGGRFLLTVFVRTQAQASGGVLTLLDHYGIPFPFEQQAGLTDSKLDLTIDLATKEIGATGHFITDNSVFKVGGQKFSVHRLDVGLRTTLVLIRDLAIAIPGLVEAEVDGIFDAATARGELDIDVHQLAYPEGERNLTLQASRQAPVHLDYEFRPADDYVQVAPSRWRFGSMIIDVDAFAAPFEPASFSGSVEDVGLSVEPGFKALVSGDFQRRSPYADLRIGVLQLGVKGHQSSKLGLQLAQPRADFSLTISDALSLSSKQSMALSYNGVPIALQPIHIRYADHELLLSESRFTIGERVSSQIAGRINPALGLAFLQLDELTVASAKGEALFVPQLAIPVNMAWNDDFLQVNAPILGLEFERSQAGFWALSLDDLGQLTPHSSLLQSAQLEEGTLRVSSRTGGLPYTFSGTMASPFGLIVLPNRSGVSTLQLSGSYDDDALDLEINKKIKIKWRDSIRISSTDVGYSWPALKRLIERLPRTGTQNSGAGDDGFKLTLQASKSFILIDEQRDLPLDALSLRYDAGKASMKFYHRGGFGTLDFTDDKLYLAGRNFSDKFFNDVMTLADFDGGRLEFSVEGALNDLNAVFRIEDTIIRDYKHLNNMLAFINTIPGLITFNPPDYNNDGLPAHEAYAGLNYGDGTLHLESLKIDSDELTLMGTGYIDFNNKTTDMDFNLVSGAKKSLNRIPLLGYILTGGKKQPSIMLKVQGDLYDPEISNTAFREVVTYPFQVLKRTVLLPVHIANQLQEAESLDEDQSQQERVKATAQ